MGLASRTFQLAAEDIDGDGDFDLLASLHSRFDAPNGLSEVSEYAVVWYENDGTGAFSDQQVIVAARHSRIHSFEAADLDGDGDVDLMIEWNDRVAWYENKDVHGGFSVASVITTNDGVGSIHAADMDGDGDVDAVISTMTGELGGTIAWYANTNGKGLFSTEPVSIRSTIGISHSIFTADFDGDGDLDLLSGERDNVRCTLASSCWVTIKGSGLLWYENTNESGQLGEGRVINTAGTGAYGVPAASAVDIDGDGDMDVVAHDIRLYGSLILTDAHISKDKIVWYENTDGHGSFSAEQLITTETWGVNSVVATDVDGDGDVDLLSSSSFDGTIAWHESDAADRNARNPGDADGDGKVAFADFLILSANFGKQVDAVWADGDFNGDGTDRVC